MQPSVNCGVISVVNLITMNNQNTFYRSRLNKVVGGVCGGLSERLNFDVSIIRLIFVLLAFVGGGVIIYIVLWIIMPERPWNFYTNEPFHAQDNPSYKSQESDETGNSAEYGTPQNANKMQTIIGAGLIVAGIVFLLGNFVSWLNILDLWPVVLIIAGLAMLFSHAKS